MTTLYGGKPTPRASHLNQTCWLIFFLQAPICRRNSDGKILRVPPTLHEVMERNISLLNNNLNREYKITVFWLTPFSISIDGDGIDC